MDRLEPAPYTAVVLVGGRARRLGGVDKTALLVGERSLRDRVVAAVADAESVVIVGWQAAEPQRSTGRLRWTCEDPVGGGPLAAIAAGLALVGTPLTLVLAGDLPFVAGLPAVLRRTLDAAPDADAAVPGQHGHAQPLAALYRTAPLRHALAEIGDPANRPVRALLPRLRIVEPAPDELAAWALADVDTPEALAAARRRAAS